jgi:glycosyltransferase involved in cell wall biosynthesis
MKLVIATPLYPPQVGGPAAYTKMLGEEWSRRGIEVRIVAYSALERALPTGIRHLVYLIRLAPAMVGAHAILALDTWSVGLPALIAARLAKKRFVVRVGGDSLWESYVGRTHELIRLSDFYLVPRRLSFKERLMRAGTRAIVRYPETRLAFNSTWQRDLWVIGYGISVEKTCVIENFFPGERASSLTKKRTFVAAGRDHPLKQAALLASVFDTIRDDHYDIELDTRALPPAEHRARIRDCYAVIISSISEVNSNTAIDAIAYGKPFILPVDSGGRAREAGILVDTRDPVALASAIRRLLDPSAYEALRARVRAFSYTHPWEAVAREFLEVLSP